MHIAEIWAGKMSVKLRLDPRASLDDTEGPMTSGKGVYAGDVAWTFIFPSE
jgi:hypothetical protein